MRVLFNDLNSLHDTIKDELTQSLSRVINSGIFLRGPEVKYFEENFASHADSRFCVSCANGTDSLYIAMRSLGVGPGDEVIVPSHSWISTSETVSQAGARVVFCDITSDTYTIDPSLIEEKVTQNTVGIIPVHLYGHPADMDSICKIADKYKLWVLEDCAQSHQADINGKRVGNFGVAGSFSFYPGKNLGAFGDAGCVVTSSRELADDMARFARHGGLTKGEHLIEGINSRMDEIQACVLNTKLPHLSSWTDLRIRAASIYNNELLGIDKITLPTVLPGFKHVWHLYVVLAEHRDELMEYLFKNGVETNINYPISLPFLPAYSRYAFQPYDFPVSFNHSKNVLSLPMHPLISSQDIKHVSNLIRHFYQTRSI